MTDGSSDTAVDPNVRRRMSNTRGRDSAPELAVRRILHAAGLRYRVNVRPVADVRRTADIVFPRQRIVVLIDGCFWHGCPDHYRPATGIRAAFWAKKIEQNRHRDEDSTILFETASWTVLRFWEHEHPEDVARSIQTTVAGLTRPRG